LPWCKVCAPEVKREKQREKTREWKKNNPEKNRECKRFYRKRHPEKMRAKRQRFKAANPGKANEYKKRWVAKNLQKYRAYRRKRYSTPRGHLNQGMSKAIGKALKGMKGGRHWESLVGYMVEDLKKHLERLFLPGMTWENYGMHGWHIDHIIPISAFNYEKSGDDDFKRCWALKNLRPLWATENLRKHNKITKQFQPRLILAHLPVSMN
jgi:hypothetical protein